jgi:SAM-dependent methyltransferase
VIPLFSNVYEDEARAKAYATLEFPGTYYLAFRDLPDLIHQYGGGLRALDFGCGTGRSSRFLRNLELDVTGVDISEAMLDQARALDPAGDYRLVHGGAGLDEFAPDTFGVILAAFTFDNILTDGEKADALTWLHSVLALGGALFLVVSSPVIYVNEWASFSTKDFPENRQARDGDRVRIVMLDVPDRRPVEDVLCTDANYRRLFENTNLEVREVRSPLATGQETTNWLSETTTAPWTIYVLRHLTKR